MKMVFRWFAGGYDSVEPWQIRQIPGVSGVATSLLNIPVGDVWPLEDILAVRRELGESGLEMEVIESVNIHESIKQAAPERDRYIENYIKTIQNLGKAGVKTLCYNFMPVLDWARSSLAYPLPDGSNAMAYEHDKVMALDLKRLADSMEGQSGGYELPGWEPSRLRQMPSLIAAYDGVTDDEYRQRVKYFLDCVIPFAESSGVRLAVHPDDPPWRMFGLPRIMNSAEGIRKYLALNPSPYNGVTICTGSLGADRNNDIPAIIREIAGMGRLHFTHVRNINFTSGLDFHESAHLSSEGSLDMYEIMRALSECKYDGYIRPDHGRAVWNEKCRPGYGLYDRAMGIQYLLGLWEALEKRRDK